MNPTATLRAGHTTATHHGRDAEQRHDPTRPAHRRRAHARGGLPRRIAGLGRRHDPRPERRRGAAGRHAAFGDDASAEGPAVHCTISLSQATSTSLTINLAYGGNAVAGRRLHAARRHHRRSRPAPRRCRSRFPRCRQRRRVRPHPRGVGGRERRLPRRFADSAAVTISSQVIPELTITVRHDDGPARRRGDVHDPRRPGAGEGHVGQLPGRRHRAARTGLRTAARHRAAAARADFGDASRCVRSTRTCRSCRPT